MTVICFYTLYLVCIRFVKVERKIYIEIKVLNLFGVMGMRELLRKKGSP